MRSGSLTVGSWVVGSEDCMRQGSQSRDQPVLRFAVSVLFAT